jgi:hypothetical protein
VTLRFNRDKIILAAIWVAAVAFIVFLERQHTAHNFGYTPDPAATKEFLASLDAPYFSDAGSKIIAGAKNRKVDTLLYRKASAAHRQVYGSDLKPWKQGIGDCVSFAWALGSYVGQSCSYAAGDLPEPPLIVATEPIYGGARCEAKNQTFAGWSDGATGSNAAKWCVGLKNGTGGILYRKKYGEIDLTTYDKSRAKNYGAYGAGGRDNTDLDKLANQHTAVGVSLIRTYEEACASIQNGMPVVICSGVGFSSTRSSDGFASRSGRWSHALCAVGVRYAETSGRDGILIQNSWGKWNSGPKWPKDQPDGSFWVEPKTLAAMLAAGDSWSIASVKGWEWKPLEHDWLDE